MDNFMVFAQVEEEQNEEEILKTEEIWEENSYKPVQNNQKPAQNSKNYTKNQYKINDYLD